MIGLFFAAVLAITDVYDFTATLSVPQVVKNETSHGRRVYRTQVLAGHLAVDYSEGAAEAPRIRFLDLTNRTFKASGTRVGYAVEVDGDVTRVHLTGDNGRRKFEKPSVVFAVTAEPDYIPGGTEPGDDNSFVLTFAGHGATSLAPKEWRDAHGGKFRVISFVCGKVSGTQGCGCSDYGHKSPTRVAGPYGPTDEVVDVADVTGTWRMSLDKTMSRR